jgi:non-homologous end joining protein Ku
LGYLINVVTGLRLPKVVAKEEEEEPEETTDILEALKASLKVKGKPSTSSVAKAKGKMGMAVRSK